jgi:hypothetical protein
MNSIFNHYNLLFVLISYKTRDIIDIVGTIGHKINDSYAIMSSTLY